MVWQRLLTVYYRVGPISVTLVVTVYMVGLGLGALFGGYVSERNKQNILVYCALELGVGLLGILSSGFLEFLGQRSVGASYALTFVCAFAFLAVLTFLMGMTLPLLTNIFSGAVHDFFRIVSLLCFVNTLGAATGAVVASYVIILLFGLRIAVYVAAAINIGIAVLIFLALRLRDARPVPATGRSGPVLGIAVGSIGMHGLLRRHRSLERKIFFLTQFLIGLFVAVSFVNFNETHRLRRADPRFLGDGRASGVGGCGGRGFADLLRRIFPLLDVFVWSCLSSTVQRMAPARVSVLLRNSPGHEPDAIER